MEIVAHTMTITCGRLKREDFSSVCFDTHQRVLVLKNSKAPSLADLRGQKVCDAAAISADDCRTPVPAPPAAEYGS
jgi:polar amino acid transport system substrate-binding protein